MPRKSRSQVAEEREERTGAGEETDQMGDQDLVGMQAQGPVTTVQGPEVEVAAGTAETTVKPVSSATPEINNDAFTMLCAMMKENSEQMKGFQEQMKENRVQLEGFQEQMNKKFVDNQEHMTELKETNQEQLKELKETNQEQLKELKETNQQQMVEINKKLDAHQAEIYLQLATTQNKIKEIEDRLDAKLDTQLQIVNVAFSNRSTQLREELLDAHDKLRGDTQSSIETLNTNLQAKIAICETQNKALEEKIHLEVSATKDQQPMREEVNQQVRILFSETELHRIREFDSIKETNCNQLKEIQSELERLKQNTSNVISMPNLNLLNSGIKIENLIHFNGDKSAIHPMTYLKNTLRYIEDLLDTKTKMNVIRATLTQSAAEWFQRIEDNCENVEHFVALFKRNYWNESQQDQVKAKLLTGKYRQGNLSREAYATRIYNTCKYVPELQESTIVRQILNHFIFTDTHAIICQNITDMDSLIDLLRKLDNHEANTQSRTRPQPQNYLPRANLANQNQGYQPRPYVPNFQQTQPTHNRNYTNNKPSHSHAYNQQNGHPSGNNGHNRFNGSNINRTNINYSRPSYHSQNTNYMNHAGYNADRNYRPSAPPERREVNNINKGISIQEEIKDDTILKKTPISLDESYRDPQPSTSRD